MRREVVLITGANGEIGHGLIKKLGEEKNAKILALDLRAPDSSLESYCDRFIQGDILDKMLLGRLMAEYEITTIYHLASILSTKAEYNPETAHEINVEGTMNLLRLGVEISQWQGYPVKFIYPSSIAVYGLPDLETKNKVGKIKENQWCRPITMYGCNKIYCEHLGRYYSLHYRQLAKDPTKNTIDFRCIRFPGLISADTVPTGGTSDYGPEMLHSAAKGESYDCFVRKDTRIPFMAMPDAIKALLDLERVDRGRLTQLSYNVTSFSPRAVEIEQLVIGAFPTAKIHYHIHENRQAIVDSWPDDVDDTPAREDWGWSPEYNADRSFNEYLIPAIKSRYSKTAN
jgi:nucleoside-diphosphate-sugar epimerase